jgi:hypothetical protein
LNSLIYSLNGGYPTSFDEGVKIYCRTLNSDFTQVDLTNVFNVINATNRVVLITHGWTENYAFYYIPELANGYLQYVDPDANICAVDYSELAQVYYLSILSPNGYNIAVPIVKFINGMISNSNLTLDSFTFFGHSFGSHLSGIVSRQLGGIREIFAADPGCYSTDGTTCNNALGLTKDCAKYVQVIASDQNYLGACTDDYNATLIFWLDMGGPIHRRCNYEYYYLGLFPTTLVDNSICPHYSSIEAQVAALNPNNLFLGRSCSDKASFVSGSCEANNCTTIGVRANRNITGNAYLFEGINSPYSNGPTCPPADAVSVSNDLANNGPGTYTYNLTP